MNASMCCSLTLFGLLGFAMPAMAAEAYGTQDFEKVPKFDAHVHVMDDADAFVVLARKLNFRVLSINTDYDGDFPSLQEQARVAHRHSRKYPDNFYFATTFSMTGFGVDGWAEWTAKYLDSEFRNGAKAVKIWKNIGMIERDASGALIFIDDPRFDPVMKRLEDEGIPLIAHQGEPWDSWQPFEKMISVDDQRYFKAAPKYYMYDTQARRAKEPSYETLIGHRDRFLDRRQAQNPGKLKFVGAHIASLDWSIDEAEKFLRTHPAAMLDLAARLPQLKYHSSRDYEKVRNFFVNNSRQIVYGTDLEFYPGDDPDGFKNEALATWRSDWAYLATAKSQPFEDVDPGKYKVVRGLNLPKEVIDRIYYTNARRIFLEKGLH